MENNINENNILIAEFLGYTRGLLTEWQNPNDKPDKDGFKPIYHPDGSDFKFNSDWNWLMTVVDKIYMIRNVSLNMTVGSLEIVYIGEKSYRKKICIAEKTGLECWYLSVVEFIKWYNNGK